MLIFFAEMLMLLVLGLQLASIGVENVEDNRRALREMLFTSEGVENHISGVVRVIMLYFTQNGLCWRMLECRLQASLKPLFFRSFLSSMSSVSAPLSWLLFARVLSQACCLRQLHPVE